MIIVKATKDSEAGVMPEQKLIAEMANYHEELAKAGVLLDGSGLQASSKGWRIQYSGEQRTVIDGPLPRPRNSCRLHAHPGEVEGRGDGVDQALPQPRCRW